MQKRQQQQQQRQQFKQHKTDCTQTHPATKQHKTSPKKCSDATRPAGHLEGVRILGEYVLE